MKAMSPARILFSAVFLPLLLASCGAMKVVANAKDKTLAGVSNIKNTIRPPRVPVVEVREKDLKELPTGEERALAFENKRKRNFWFFSGPVDFKEPTLPSAGGEMDNSLLPPVE